MEITVPKLIEVLNKTSNHEKADIEFWIGDERYELDRIGQFQVIPHVTFQLVPYDKKKAKKPFKK